MKTYDVIVIGSGVAGMTAAIYLKRANLNVLIIEKTAPGGQINVTDEICNYPGFTNVKGPELAMNFYAQVANLKIDFVIEEVVEIRNNGEPKEVITNLNHYQTTRVVIATGRKPKTLGLPNEERLTGRGISYCAICDGPLYKDKIVAVVGGGNSAVDEGIYLTKLASKVFLIHRNHELKAEKMAIQKLASINNCEMILNHELTEYVLEGQTLKAIKIVNKETNQERIIDLDGIFMFIGYEPTHMLIKDLKISDEQGYIKADMNMRTSAEGIYACGDAIQKDVYQIATAVGEGAVAATSVINDLSKK